MSSFRRRSQRIIHSSAVDAHLVTTEVGETTYVSQVFVKTSPEIKFPDPSPTLDELIEAGVSPKEVDVNGIMDSYDVNDTPLNDIEEKIVTKVSQSRKKKSELSPDENV